MKIWLILLLGLMGCGQLPYQWAALCQDFDELVEATAIEELRWAVKDPGFIDLAETCLDVDRYPGKS